jgi:hypothetical protein
LAGRSFISAVASRLPVHDPYIAIQIFISFVTLFGAITFTRGSLYLLTSHSTFSRWAALLVAFMAYFNLPFVYGLAYTLPYDLPSLFFFTGCIFCVLRRSYFLFYLLFMLGIFNRETICFVTLFFLVWELSQTRLQDLPRASISRTSRLEIMLHVGLQAALWIAIKIYLKHRFALNPQENGGAGLFVPHFSYNLHELFKPQQWPLLVSNFGFTLPLLISQRKWICNAGIARACAVMLPLWLCLMFYVGVIIEIRIYTELIGLVSLAVALIGFNRWFVVRDLDGVS